MTAHRALPLTEVERRAQAARKPWTSCSGAGCSQGRQPESCDCRPAAEMAVYDPTDDDQSNSADAEVVMLILKALGCLLLACLAAWLIAGGPNTDAWTMFLDWLEVHGV